MDKYSVAYIVQFIQRMSYDIGHCLSNNIIYIYIYIYIYKYTFTITIKVFFI